MISIEIKLGKYPLPIWKGLSAFNMHILIFYAYLQSWRHGTLKYQCKDSQCNFFTQTLIAKYCKLLDEPKKTNKLHELTQMDL